MLLRSRLVRAQYKVRLFVFIIISTRTFDFLVLMHWNKRPENIHIHLEDLENSKTALKPALTGREKARLEACLGTTEHDVRKELEQFEANSNICVSHHTYLKGADSFVVQVGGYDDEDTVSMVNMYNPRVVVLEPVDEFANILREKFKSNSRVTVLTLGLGKSNGFVSININDNTPDGNTEALRNTTVRNATIHVKNATEFFSTIRVGKFDIDLLMMNCRGCELVVLENVFESGLVKYFKNIQFKSAEPLQHLQKELVNTKERYCTVQEILSRTHRPTFQFKHVYENWRRNDLI